MKQPFVPIFSEIEGAVKMFWNSRSKGPINTKSQATGTTDSAHLKRGKKMGEFRITNRFPLLRQGQWDLKILR